MLDQPNTQNPNFVPTGSKQVAKNSPEAQNRLSSTPISSRLERRGQTFHRSVLSLRIRGSQTTDNLLPPLKVWLRHESVFPITRT